MNVELLNEAAEAIIDASRVIAFTGAGISVESGIPPFRGPQGIWSKYDPRALDIGFYRSSPDEAWDVIREIFYDHINVAEPNDAHYVLAEMEANDLLHGVVTQNIDNLHRLAGSGTIIEYHGNSQRLICLQCNTQYNVSELVIEKKPPRCEKCHNVIKPDFVFFGEPIPYKAHQLALRETSDADIWLVIGTTGEVFPAASLPIEAKFKGKKIIEINIRPSNYTYQISDIFLEGPAAETSRALLNQIIDLTESK